MEMDNFKSITDDLWTDMVKLGAGTPTTRAKRQGQYGGCVLIQHISHILVIYIPFNTNLITTFADTEPPAPTPAILPILPEADPASPTVPPTPASQAADPARTRPSSPTCPDSPTVASPDSPAVPVVPEDPSAEETLTAVSYRNTA